jgi:hypothetical protein
MPNMSIKTVSCSDVFSMLLVVHFDGI